MTFPRDDQQPQELTRIVMLELAIGLPSRCECPAPFEVRSNERWAVVCEWCGGLVRSDAERAEW